MAQEQPMHLENSKPFCCALGRLNDCQVKAGNLLGCFRQTSGTHTVAYRAACIVWPGT